MRAVFNHPLFLWVLLGHLAVVFAYGYATGGAEAGDLLHPTGEFSIRFMVLAMLIGPLSDIFGSRGWTRWLLRRRRWIGVAAFGYALLHLIFYIIDMGALSEMLAELDAPGIWTGWIAFFLMLVPALLSNDQSMRWLKRGWKQAQRLAYPAALFTVLHWGLLEWEWGGALIHIAPLVIANIVRIIVLKGRRT